MFIDVLCSGSGTGWHTQVALIIPHDAASGKNGKT